MKIALTGASGFIGRHVVPRLLEAGHSIRALGRKNAHEAVPFFAWDAARTVAPREALEGMDAGIHLAGEPVAQRWNEEVKRRIAESRIVGTRNLVSGIAQCDQRPLTLISASAIG